MASAPLNWLLKIGSTALKTTAQTLTGAVNELKDSISSLQSQISSQLSTVAADMSKKVNKTDVLNLEEIEATTDLTDKVAAAEAVKEVNDSLVSDIYVGDDGKLHKVQGGADSVLPFSSTIYKLGTGRSFNIANIVGYENIGKYSANNFIVIPRSMTTSFNNTMASCNGSFIEGNLSYNASNGHVTVNGYTFVLYVYRSAGNQTITTNATVDVYFLDTVSIVSG